jgi:hypothetical protein
LRCRLAWCCFGNTGTGGGLLVGSGSANRTEVEDDLLVMLDFMEDRLSMLDEDNEDTLDMLLRDDRTDVGVVVPLEVDMISGR